MEDTNNNETFQKQNNLFTPRLGIFKNPYEGKKCKNKTNKSY